MGYDYNCNISARFDVSGSDQTQRNKQKKRPHPNKQRTQIGLWVQKGGVAVLNLQI